MYYGLPSEDDIPAIYLSRGYITQYVCDLSHLSFLPAMTPQLKKSIVILTASNQGSVPINFIDSSFNPGSSEIIYRLCTY
jgi:hypothetical protein